MYNEHISISIELSDVSVVDVLLDWHSSKVSHYYSRLLDGYNNHHYYDDASSIKIQAYFDRAHPFSNFTMLAGF